LDIICPCWVKYIFKITKVTNGRTNYLLPNTWLRHLCPAFRTPVWGSYLGLFQERVVLVSLSSNPCSPLSLLILGDWFSSVTQNLGWVVWCIWTQGITALLQLTVVSECSSRTQEQGMCPVVCICTNSRACPIFRMKLEPERC
jgi:hypothetical protein